MLAEVGGRAPDRLARAARGRRATCCSDVARAGAGAVRRLGRGAARRPTLDLRPRRAPRSWPRWRRASRCWPSRCVIAVEARRAPRRSPARSRARGVLAIATRRPAGEPRCVSGSSADDRQHSLNVRGAWLHVLSDALGSVGAMVAGVLRAGLRLAAGPIPPRRSRSAALVLVLGLAPAARGRRRADGGRAARARRATTCAGRSARLARRAQRARPARVDARPAAASRSPVTSWWSDDERAERAALRRLHAARRPLRHRPRHASRSSRRAFADETPRSMCARRLRCRRRSRYARRGSGGRAAVRLHRTRRPRAAASCATRYRPAHLAGARAARRARPHPPRGPDARRGRRAGRQRDPVRGRRPRGRARDRRARPLRHQGHLRALRGARDARWSFRASGAVAIEISIDL